MGKLFYNGVNLLFGIIDYMTIEILEIYFRFSHYSSYMIVSTWNCIHNMNS